MKKMFFVRAGYKGAEEDAFLERALNVLLQRQGHSILDSESRQNRTIEWLFLTRKGAVNAVHKLEKDKRIFNARLGGSYKRCPEGSMRYYMVRVTRNGYGSWLPERKSQ